jgi:hypothetical protein
VSGDPARPDDPLARAIGALEGPPPPPPVGRVLARLHEPVAPSRWAGPLAWGRPTRVALACVALFAVIVGVLVADATRATRRRDESDRVAFAVVLEGRPEVRRGGAEGPSVPAGEGAVGDVLRSDASARVRLSSGVEIALDAGSSLVLEGGRDLRLTAGRARFDAGPAAPDPLRVTTATVTVVDRGTRFGVDLAKGTWKTGGDRTSGGNEHVRVTVEEGKVEANGVALAAGVGIAFLDGRPDGEPWPLDARPTVALEVETAAPAAGDAVVLRIVLRNPTGGWIPLPEPDLVRAPVWIEVTPPGGSPSPVRVTADLLVSDDPPPTAIAPRGETSIRVRFDRTFASPGTYRLRAVYRPGGAVERPASPEVQLTVR